MNEYLVSVLLPQQMLTPIDYFEGAVVFVVVVVVVVVD